MCLDEFVGNVQTVDSLKQSLNNKKFAHSVLLCGEGGTGTNYLARLLAADYLYAGEKDEIAKRNGTQQVLSNNSPEYIVIEGTGANGDIPVELIRTARKDIFGTSLSAGGRVVHIKKAQNLNAFSANALLKVLEEPPENVLFILTAASQSAVLPTLRSRCNVYTVTAPSEGECAEYLQKAFKNTNGIKERSAQLANIFAGKIGLCTYCIAEKEGAETLEDATKIKDALYEKNKYKALCKISKYEKDKQSARVMLDMLAQLCAADLRRFTGKDTAGIAAKTIKNCGEAKRLLNRNVNIKTVLVCFCI